jgi:outer membrane protein assembly factor BamA
VGIRFSSRFFSAALLLAALALPLPALSLAAQEKPEPRGRISDLHVSGSKRYAEASILAACGLKPGDTVGREELQAAADRLAALGPFSVARYRFSSKGEEISVEFQVQDATTVPVWFDNFPWFTDAELTEGLKQAVTLFDGTAPQQGTILDAMDAALQQMLASRGVQASVEHSVVAEPGSDRMILEFKAEGANLKVNAVQFSDALAAESPRVQSLLGDLVGKPFSRFTLAVFVNEQVTPLYLEKGYLRVKFGSPQARFTGDPLRPLPDNIRVFLPIEPGPMYHWAGLEWADDAPASRSILDPLIPLKAGDVVNGVQLTGLWHRLEDEYGKHGFLEAKVDPQASYDDVGEKVSFRVSIHAGPQYHMGELVVTGLSVLAEKKLREAWRIPQGQIFDRSYYEEFLSSGLKQAFADYPLHYDKAGHWLRTNPETRTVDVLLDFQ